MANFKQHLSYGFGASCVCSLIGFWQFGLSAVESMAACILGSLASLTPDLDHHQGRPGRIMAEIIIAVLPVFLYLNFQNRYQYFNKLNLEHWIVIFCCGYFLVRYAFLDLMAWITAHRGIMHSLPATIICGQIIFLTFSHLPDNKRLIIAIIGALGYLTHLITDEIYGVDWGEMETKQSFGTAVDLGKIKGVSTWVAYSVIVLLGWIIWSQYHPGSEHSFAAVLNHLKK